MVTSQHQSLSQYIHSQTGLSKDQMPAAEVFPAHMYGYGTTYEGGMPNSNDA
jgi:hypothetical protein